MLDFVLNFFVKFEKINLIDIIFPPVCGICGIVNSNWLCDKCEKRLEKYRKNKLLNMQLQDDTYFDDLFYCFEYKKLIRNLLLKYKFSDGAYLCNFFANIMIKDKKINEILKKYDIIIPVPMDKTKRAKRGYNQTELITKILSKNNIICENADCLIKIKQTKTQSTLSGEKRAQNVKNAFKLINVNWVKNKKIILFDDICTTGSTANEISKILKEAGAENILVLVIAKD